MVHAIVVSLVLFYYTKRFILDFDSVVVVVVQYVVSFSFLSFPLVVFVDCMLLLFPTAVQCYIFLLLLLTCCVVGQLMDLTAKM